jgi:hypothetical protein
MADTTISFDDFIKSLPEKPVAKKKAKVVVPTLVQSISPEAQTELQNQQTNDAFIAASDAGSRLLQTIAQYKNGLITKDDAAKVYDDYTNKIDRLSALDPVRADNIKQSIVSKPTQKTEVTKVSPENKPAKTPEQKPEDFAGLIKTAPDFIRKMSGPERKLLAQSLNDSLGLKLPVTELIDPGALLGAYQRAISGAQARYNTFKDIFSVDQFLAQKKLETAAVNAAGGSSGAANLPYGQIYDKTAAKAKVNEIVKSVLNREATDKEISSLSAQIIKAQKDNPYRTVNGRTVGGLNVDQFLTDIVQAMPEYASKKQAQQDLTAQGINSTALANGIKLTDAQLKTYSDRVKNGEDIKTIESQIRNAAGLGHPDSIKKMLADGTDLTTIYDPYRRVMATSLGVTPDSITLDDPTLRMAIGPDKEMSLYDFKKAIRQDNRWKYSQEANDEVTNMVNQVKRDFGFMG